MARRRTPKMTRYEAESLLGLTGSYSYQDYQKAFKEAVKRNHPDMGGDAATMVKVNAAKDAILYYFGDDKSQVLTCAVSQEASTAEQVAAESAYYNEESQEQVRQSRDAIWAKMGFSFIDDDYTGKPQAEWSQADWDAFDSFRVPSRFRDADPESPDSFDRLYESVFIDKVRIKQANTTIWESDNLDTTLWNDEDWFYYVFANTVSNNRGSWDATTRLQYEVMYRSNKFDPVSVDRCPKRDDGAVYVIADNSRHLHGIYWEREQARLDPNYESKQKLYWTKHTEPGCFIDTPFGYARMTTTSALDDWEDAINVPFAYSNASYDYWRERNLEAWRKADEERKPRQRKRKPMIEPVADWTGLEFIVDSDSELLWVVEGKKRQARTSASEANHQAGNMEADRKVATGGDGLAQHTWVARHEGIAGWLFVLLVYLLLPGLSGAICLGVFGNVDAAMIPAFVLQAGGIVAAIAFRKRVVQWFRRVQNQALGKA